MAITKAMAIWRDTSNYQKFLRKFADRYRHMVQDLQHATAAEGAVLAHKFRGGAANLGLDDVAAAALSLEQVLQRNEPADRALREFKNALRTALDSIARYAPPSKDAVPLSEMESASLTPLLSRLLDAWQSDSSVEVEWVLAEIGHVLPNLKPGTVACGTGQL
jgi:HPt (histidine-containing phosphotransfer) domain-containing protein